MGQRWAELAEMQVGSRGVVGLKLPGAARRFGRLREQENAPASDASSRVRFRVLALMACCLSGVEERNGGRERQQGLKIMGV